MKTLDPRTGYDLYAPSYRKDHGHLDSFDWAEIQPRLAHHLAAIIDINHSRTVRALDMGCGDGRVLKRLVRLREQRAWHDRLELHGWDISEGMLKQARKILPADVHLQCLDLLDCAETPMRFHVVWSFFVLVHVGGALDFLRSAAQLLEPGGLFIFNNIPQKSALTLEQAGTRFQIHYEHHESAEVLEGIANAGLELIERLAAPWSEVFVVRKATPATVGHEANLACVRRRCRGCVPSSTPARLQRAYPRADR